MKTHQSSLLLPKLSSGVLIKRYKRFLADILLDTGVIVTAHCPNSGSMTACCEPGRRVYVSCHNDPRRKLKYTWELIEMPSSLVGINTLVPNRLVFQSLKAGILPEFKSYDSVKQEVKVGGHSRLDIVMTRGQDETCYMEIKNCTLVVDGIACFPDAVTERGRKHLLLLRELASAGHRCVMFFLIQRMDAKIFKPADHIDPAYGRELRSADAAGVEILVYDVTLDLEKIRLGKALPYCL
ncbi:MAG: DNA/RNA nuclease SfsA [Desulfobacterales bacterium]|nr:DNA/RNA nuclease SfsA [Desulfobacterales bacterium]